MNLFLVDPPVPTCPLDCSGHGNCNTSSLLCTCFTSWAGNGCEYAISPLSLNTVVSGTISRDSTSPAIVWNFWRATLDSGNVLLATVTPVSCTLNLYAGFQSVPDVNNYWVAVRAQSKEVMRYDDPNLGVWTFGLASTSNCTYSLNVTTLWKCPNDCSGHGTCNAQTGACACDANYTMLADCSQALFPSGDGVQFGSLQPLSWSYYSYTSSGNDLAVQVNVTAAQMANTPTREQHSLVFSAPGAYLRAGIFPELFNYDQACNSIAVGQACTLHITKPTAGNWILGLWGASAASFSVQFAGNTLCPNQCSGYGTCGANGVCQCPTYYNNPDCSFYLHPLTPNTAQSAPILISPDQFQYFTFSSAGHSNDMTFTVNQTTLPQPTLNLVILASCASTPTPFDYDFYTFCDNTASLCAISILKAPPCAWTFAVWSKPETAFFSFASKPTARLGTQTTDSTSSHGQGSSRSSSQRRSGDSAKQQLQQIATPQIPRRFDASSISHSNVHENRTRSAHKTQSRHSMAKSGSSSSSTFFASSSSHYSSSSIGTASSSSYLNVNAMGSSSRGVAVSTQVEYTVTLDTTIQCPNDCNGHGTCQAPGTCLCDPNYASTADCSTFIYNLVNNSAYPSHIDPDQWRFYSVVANMDNYLSFTITNLAGGSIEAYLSRNALPSRLDYMKAISPGNQTMYQLSTTASSSPINGTYYLGVFGRDLIGTSYSITAVADRACPAGCSLNGLCTSSGTCICNPGYVKSDCSALSVALPANLEVQGMVRFDTWSYYNMTILGDDALEIWLRENDNLIDGLVWVFIAKDRLPTIEDHDFSNQTDSIMHTVFIPSGQTRGLWMIGVTGSPRATGSSYGRQAKYNLFATSGCGTYASCDTCVLDPNCGWCRNQPFDPAAGRCVPGNDQTSLNQTCLFYQYSTCSLKSDMNMALAKGLIIGVSVGLFILIAAGITAFLLYRYYKQWEKSGLRPALLYPQERHRGGHGGMMATSSSSTTSSPSQANQMIAGEDSNKASTSAGPLHPHHRHNNNQHPSQQQQQQHSHQSATGSASSSASSLAASNAAASIVYNNNNNNNSNVNSSSSIINNSSARLIDDHHPDSAVIMLDDGHHVNTAHSDTSSVSSLASPSNYGTMSGDAVSMSSDAVPATLHDDGVYYSFGGVDTYTDSDVDSGEYSSDSEAE